MTGPVPAQTAEARPAEGTDLLAALVRTARERGDAPALTGPDGRTLGHTALCQAVLATAEGLRSVGFRHGDRVLFSVRPDPRGVVLALGVVAAGGTVVFADPGVAPEVFAARFALAAPRWAAAESLLYAAAAYGRGAARRRGLLLPDYRSLGVRHIYAGHRLPGVPRGALSARALARTPTSRTAVSPDPEQEALVVFTSGTTSDPKAVLHTRGSLGAGLAGCAPALGLDAGGTVHTDQLMIGVPALVAGAHWTMPAFGLAPAADPARFARGLAGATHAFCVPADLPAVLSAVDAGTVRWPSSLRHLVLGGAPVPTNLLRRVARTLPEVRVLVVYGMTEIVPAALTDGATKLAYDGPGDLLGEPLPGVRARIADDGELLLSGPNMCRGHLGRPPLTEVATGDVVRIDDGRLILAGRKKDMLIRGRTNIYPGLYEPAVAALPGVREAVIIGVPDEYGDEHVVLVLTADDGPAHAGSDAALVTSVRSALPGVVDAAALPDEIRVTDRIPVSGRARKPDRAALQARIERESM